MTLGLVCCETHTRVKSRWSLTWAVDWSWLAYGGHKLYNELQSRQAISVTSSRLHSYTRRSIETLIFLRRYTPPSVFAVIGMTSMQLEVKNRVLIWRASGSDWLAYLQDLGQLSYKHSSTSNANWAPAFWKINTSLINDVTLSLPKAAQKQLQVLSEQNTGIVWHFLLYYLCNSWLIMHLTYMRLPYGQTCSWTDLTLDKDVRTFMKAVWPARMVEGPVCCQWPIVVHRSCIQEVIIRAFTLWAWSSTLWGDISKK